MCAAVFVQKSHDIFLGWAANDWQDVAQIEDLVTYDVYVEPYVFLDGPVRLFGPQWRFKTRNILLSFTISPVHPCLSTICF